jgi:DnaJ-class molecular chaperone
VKTRYKDISRKEQIRLSHPQECRACFGYGHLTADGEPTIDRRERKCLNCNGTGKSTKKGSK